MQPIYTREFEITDNMVDRYGALRPSSVLFFAQEVAGEHCKALAVDYDTLARRRMFWAVTRHRVQITRMPRRGETIRIETWHMPTTRVAYPRSLVAYDREGNECFRSIALWVLMDLDTRNMILPGKSGIELAGSLRGTELAIPKGVLSTALGNQRSRSVCFTDLDRNGHMNNTRYLDWIDDLLPSAFHCEHTLKEFTVCYLSEAREGQSLNLKWDFPANGILQVDALRHTEDREERVFCAKMLFE
ncbi:MAG: thioesterase [Eubacteriales bacterium]|nr:thioesterase [Eubacteriales bacterium]